MSRKRIDYECINSEARIGRAELQALVDQYEAQGGVIERVSVCSSVSDAELGELKESLRKLITDNKYAMRWIL